MDEHRMKKMEWAVYTAWFMLCGICGAEAVEVRGSYKGFDPQHEDGSFFALCSHYRLLREELAPTALPQGKKATYAGPEIPTLSKDQCVLHPEDLEKVVEYMCDPVWATRVPKEDSSLEHLGLVGKNLKELGEMAAGTLFLRSLIEKGIILPRWAYQLRKKAVGTLHCIQRECVRKLVNCMVAGAPVLYATGKKSDEARHLRREAIALVDLALDTALWWGIVIPALQDSRHHAVPDPAMCIFLQTLSSLCGYVDGVVTRLAPITKSRRFNRHDL